MVRRRPAGTRQGGQFAPKETPDRPPVAAAVLSKDWERYEDPDTRPAWQTPISDVDLHKPPVYGVPDKPRIRDLAEAEAEAEQAWAEHDAGVDPRPPPHWPEIDALNAAIASDGPLSERAAVVKDKARRHILDEELWDRRWAPFCWALNAVDLAGESSRVAIEPAFRMLRRARLRGWEWDDADAGPAREAARAASVRNAAGLAAQADSAWEKRAEEPSYDIYMHERESLKCEARAWLAAAVADQSEAEALDRLADGPVEGRNTRVREALLARGAARRRRATSTSPRWP